MNMFGFSINLLILFALVLAVGLVVDDAIVVLENTQRHIQDGKSPKEATEITMKEVLSPVVATSLVLMAVFVPVSFMAGITGQMFRQFALCIASSIGLSTVVALTLAPALCAMILDSNTEKADYAFIDKFNTWFNDVREKYLGIAKKFINNIPLTLAIYGAILALIVVFFLSVPSGFIPTEDKGTIFSQIQLPEGSSASRTSEVADAIDKKIRTIPGVENTIVLVGMNGENTAFIVTELEDFKYRKKKELAMESILGQINRMFANYPSAIIASFPPPSISGLGMFGGLEFQILDKAERSPQELYEETIKFISAAMREPEYSMVYTSFTANLPQLMMLIDEEKALSQGVDISTIYSALAGYFGKSYVNDFNKFGRVYRVYLQADAPFREKPADIDKIYVKNNQGKMVPLNAVIKYKNVTGPYSLTRFNMYEAVTVNASVKAGKSSGQAMKKFEEIADKVLPRDIGYEWSGSSLQEKDSSGQIGAILAMSLVFVYLFLVGLYESWMLPVAVLLISPIAMVGALAFIAIQAKFGGALDIYAQIGLVMLIGLSTKQAILIIEFAKEAHENGLSIKEAAVQAAYLRFRAVMMTNIAFILGLVPLVTATGAGAASRHSVGMTVFGGMMAVAFIGTFLVPAFYVMIEEMKVNVAKFIRSKKDKHD